MWAYIYTRGSQRVKTNNIIKIRLTYKVLHVVAVSITNRESEWMPRDAGVWTIQ